MDRRHLSEEDELALIGVAAPALLSLLEKRRDTSLAQLYGEFRKGTADLRPVVATYCAYVDLIRDIENKLANRETKKE